MVGNATLAIVEFIIDEKRASVMAITEYSRRGIGSPSGIVALGSCSDIAILIFAFAFECVQR